jgi:hypothetical protein
VDQQQKQTILDLPKVIAVGIAAPIASLLTSRFGIAGTMLGLAISSVILTVLVDALKVYLARASTKVVKVPSELRTELSRQGTRGRSRALLSKVLSFLLQSLSPMRRRSILIGSLMAAGVSFFVGLIVITGVEASVGKSLSCWVWNECPTEESSAGGDEASSTSTLPSILGGGQSASSSAPVVRPVGPQQQPTPPGPTGSPSVPPSKVPGAQGADSGAPTQGQNESSPSEEDQQQSPANYSDEEQQQNPSNSNEEVTSGEGQGDSSPGSGQNIRQPEYPSVPWTT